MHVIMKILPPQIILFYLDTDRIRTIFVRSHLKIELVQSSLVTSHIVDNPSHIYFPFIHMIYINSKLTETHGIYFIRINHI